MRNHPDALVLTSVVFFLVFSTPTWAVSGAGLPTTKVQVQADPIIVNLVKVEASPIVVRRIIQSALLENPPEILKQPPNLFQVLLALPICQMIS